MSMSRPAALPSMPTLMPRAVSTVTNSVEVNACPGAADRCGRNVGSGLRR